ncbi:Ankyrin repeat and protein kinase domain-containing protein 1 [Hondaea fermentalgiana]|uniref:Ankyrin repeat and protein kinase domain-containing protein 1 n=1 Tax=Hondaea fermentalgiana TaxID=2315210 RepID=A0A2R5GGN1_9STRA|nr:Ankyrin repeat and protein kinase domain-containing protein 1 [Hondaea fermentalgiana]|eukprot:GBG28918.1 Ankyrin repeat and protein kinase domain-containing protein 1 [Hondaea fermentalgiana]
MKSQVAAGHLERKWTDWIKIEVPGSLETVAEPDKQTLVEAGKDTVEIDTETNTSEGDDSIVTFTIIEEDEDLSHFSKSLFSGVIAAKDLLGSRLKSSRFELECTDGSNNRIDVHVASGPLESAQLERPTPLRVDISDHSFATSCEILFLEASGRLQVYDTLNLNEIHCLQADKICALHIRGVYPDDIEEVPLHNAQDNILPHWHDKFGVLFSAYDPREVCLSALSLFEQLGRLFAMVQSQLNDASKSIVRADTSRDMLLQLLSSAGTSLQFPSKEDESCFLHGIESNGIGGVDAEALAQLLSDLHVLAQSSSPDTQPGREEALQRILRILSDNISEVLAVHRVVHSPESSFDIAHEQRVSHFKALVGMRDNEMLKALAFASLTPRAVRADLNSSWYSLFVQWSAHQDECSAVLETLLGVQAALVRAQVPGGYREAVFEASEDLGHEAISSLFLAQLGDSVTVNILRRMLRKVHGEDGHTRLSLFSVRGRRSPRFWTSLQRACQYGYIECVRELISHRADIQAVSPNGDTPVQIAVRHRSVEIVQLLCTKGARRDDAALLSSIENGQVEILQILHSHWPEAAKMYRGELDRTLLHIACERQGSGEDKIVPALIQMGVSVNEVDVIGRTALHNAASMGNPSAVRCLMEAGADDTLPTRLEGSTIIHEAAKKGRISVLQFLLQNSSGETVDALDRRGRTPVCYAFDRRKYLEMALFCLFESLKCASHEAIRNMSFTGEIKTFASLIEQRYSSPHRSKQEKNEIKILKGKLKIMCGSAFESDFDTSFPIFDENVLSFFPEESCRALGAMDLDTPEKELKSMLRDVIEALFVEIRRADAILSILLEAGADIDHVDDDDKPAFDDAYRLEYFETKRDELETAFIRRSGLAHDQPIFRNKIMHQAVHAAWVDQGLRFKAFRALAYWAIVLGLLTLVAIRYSGRDVYESYSIQATISNRVSSGTAGDLEDVSDLDSWNDYVENVFIEALWPAADVSDSSSNENMLGGGLTFLGRPRYRQVRTLPESCSATMPSLLPAADATCYAPYSQGTFKALDDTLENRTDFGCKLRNGTDLDIAWEDSPAVPFFGKFGFYKGGGVSVSFDMPDRLGEDSSAELIVLDQEEQEWWVCEAKKMRNPDDPEGRSNVQIQNGDKIFDPQDLRWLPTGKHVKDGHFAIGQVAEVAAGPNRQACSGMIVSVNVHSEPCTYSVFTFSSPSVLLQYVPENAIREVSDYAIAEIRSPPRGNKFLARSTARQHRKGVGLLRARALDLIHAAKGQFGRLADEGFSGVLASLFGDISPYWSDPFNYIDLSIMFLACALVAAHLSLLSKVADKRVNWQETSASNVFIDVSDIMWYATIRQYLLAGVVFLCYLKTLEYLRVAATFAIPVMIIIGMLVKLMSFLAILAVFVLAFGLFDYVVFGLKYAPANSVMKALVFTVRGALGELDFDGKYEMDQIVGTGMTMLAAVLLVILLLNLLIAVMSEAYEEVKSTAEARWCYMQFAAIYRREQGAEFWTILWQSRPAQALRVLLARCFNAGGLSAQQQVVPVNVSDRTDVVAHDVPGKLADPNRD